MLEQFKGFWGDYVVPIYKRPDRLQFAALCYRGSGAETRVLLITSRGTGRWVLPKGWPMRGRDAAGTAMQEAWEEAGLKAGSVDRVPLGSFVYDKGLNSGWSIPVRAIVYAVRAEDMADDFPEREERNRRWVRPEEAAKMVDEPELRRLLRTFRPRDLHCGD